MKRLKNLTILLCFLSLLALISCSAEDKTGVKDNPPEDTEITDGETGSGSSSGGSSETGDGTETGGETGTSGSEEGEGEPETPPTPIKAKDFPPELFGTYRDERIYNKFKDERDDAKVSLSGQEIWIRGTQMLHKKDGSDGTQAMDWRMKEWKKTTKGETIIKVEGESFSEYFDFETHEKTIVGKTIITFDYESKTVSVIFTTYTPDGVDTSFYGKKIN